GDQLNAVRREVLLDLLGALRRSDSLSRQANTGWLEAVLRHIRVGPRRDVGDWGGGGRVGPQVIGGRIQLRRASDADLRDEPVLVRLELGGGNNLATGQFNTAGDSRAETLGHLELL